MKKSVTGILLLLTVVLAALGLAALGLTGCGGGGSSAEQVRVYCFGDYIDPALIDTFEAETGIEVVMDVFDTNEEMYPVISNQSVNYDVICASDYMIDKLIGENLLQEIDFSNIPNLQNISPKYLQQSQRFDPENRYTVPHTWGTLGILYDPDKVPAGSITSWQDLWDKDYSQQIVMPDSMRDTLAIALKAKGHSLNTTDEAQIAEAADALIQQKPLVYKYANDSARDLLLGGSAAIAVVWNGEVLYCRAEDPDLQFVVPEEGTEMFIDSWAIPAAAEHKENAEKWINFMLDRDTALTNFAYLTYSIPNQAVIDEVSDDPVKMDILFPSDALLEKCESLKNLGSEADDLYTEYWKKFKS